MYAIITEAKGPMQFYDIRGTIGTESITKENIIADTLTLSNQCSDTSEFRLGGVYIGQLSGTFYNVDIPRNEWVGKEITLEVQIGETWIPIGVFVVDKATHAKGFVSVTAYDRMLKLDKVIGIEVGAHGYAYDMLDMLCTACNVTLGMTRQQVEALPNGNQAYLIAEMGDIETWRDLLFWLATSMCAFATFDRSGNLVLRKYHGTADDEIDYDVRYSVSTYGDEVITYTGINVYSVEDEEVEYYAAEVDDGYTLNVGNNPLFQSSKAQRQQYVANMLTGIADIQYNACKVEVPFAWHYDLGDVLSFPNGNGSDTDLFCIMGYTLKFNGHCALSGIAGQKASMSKTDKNLQGMMSTVSRNEFTSYELRNVGRIVIEDGESERLVQARIASNTSTKAAIHIEVNLASAAAEDYTQGTVYYLIDSEDAQYYPTETWIDGNHVLHLMYILPLEANTIKTFDVYMESDGGEITIEAGGVWFFASGAGLVGDGKWDGTIKIQEDAETFTFIEVSMASAAESISANTQSTTAITHTEVASVFNFNELSVDNATDSVLVTLRLNSFALVTENGDTITTEDSKALYTEGD